MIKKIKKKYLILYDFVCNIFANTDTYMLLLSTSDFYVLLLVGRGFGKREN